MRAILVALVGAGHCFVAVSSVAAQPAGTAVASAQSPLIEGPMTPPEARLASVGRVVIYYGPGIHDADATADILREHRVPAVAISGASAGQLFLLVDGRPNGKYTQRDLDRATLAQVAMQLYRERMTKGAPAPKGAQ